MFAVDVVFREEQAISTLSRTMTPADINVIKHCQACKALVLASACRRAPRRCYSWPVKVGRFRDVKWPCGWPGSGSRRPGPSLTLPCFFTHACFVDVRGPLLPRKSCPPPQRHPLRRTRQTSPDDNSGGDGDEASHAHRSPHGSVVPRYHASHGRSPRKVGRRRGRPTKSNEHGNAPFPPLFFFFFFFYWLGW